MRLLKTAVAWTLLSATVRERKRRKRLTIRRRGRGGVGVGTVVGRRGKYILALIGGLAAIDFLEGKRG